MKDFRQTAARRGDAGRALAVASGEFHRCWRFFGRLRRKRRQLTWFFLGERIFHTGNLPHSVWEIRFSTGGAAFAV